MRRRWSDVRSTARDPDGLRGLWARCRRISGEKAEEYTLMVLCVEHFSEWWIAQKEAAE